MKWFTGLISLEKMNHLIRSLLKISCLSLCFVTSCVSGDRHDVNSCDVIVDLDQFTAVDMSNSGRVITHDPEILGIVSGVEAINDSLVAICQNQANAHVVLYNLNSNLSQTAMTRGEGPNEMLRVCSMSSTPNGDLWLVGMMDRKVVKVHWRDNENRATVAPAYRLPEDFLRGVTDAKGGIIGLPTGLHDLRLYETNNIGLTVDSMGNYPKVKMPENVCPNNFMFQSDIGISPDANLIVLACKSWNYIDIIDTQTKQSICLKLPIDEPIELEKYEIGQAVSYNPKPFWLMFSGVEVTDKSFFVGYLGVKIETPEDMQKNMTSILEFDLSGNPLRRLNFGNELVAFSISRDGSRLFTVENAPDPTLYEYTLN